MERENGGRCGRIKKDSEREKMRSLSSEGERAKDFENKSKSLMSKRQRIMEEERKEG